MVWVRRLTEPVDSIDDALEDGQEGIDNPVLHWCQCVRQREGAEQAYCQPLGIIDLATAEQRLEGVVPGNDEAGEVDEELSSDVKEDEEEVEANEAEEDVDLGDIGLLLEIVEHRILAKL